MKYPHPVPEKIMTLGILYQDGKALFAQKLRGVGKGRWNGYGGKVESGESIESAMKREVEEESTVVPTEHKEIGINTFHVHYEGGVHVWRVHNFKITKWEGVPKETEEMGAPTWFEEKDIPYDEMWQDDKFWLKHFFADRGFDAEYWFDEKDRIVKDILELRG